MATARVLDKRKNAAAIIAWTVDGKSSREVVDLLKKQRRVQVTPQAVQGFIRRHRAQIDELTNEVAAKVTEAVIDVTIADKTERLRILDDLTRRMYEVIDKRGIMASDPKWVTTYAQTQEDGETVMEAGTSQLVTVERFDSALVRELRGVLDDAAAEVGGRPKTPLIDARTQVITLAALDELMAEVE